ncbi:hypothetical protein Tco_0132419 [Tanacetum coccineum]
MEQCEIKMMLAQILVHHVVESDYESWKIRIHRFYSRQTNGKSCMDLSRMDHTPHPMITDSTTDSAACACTNGRNLILTSQSILISKPSMPSCKKGLSQETRSSPATHIVDPLAYEEAPGNVGNTGARGKKVIATTAQRRRGLCCEGQDKVKGVVLDAEAMHASADVECTAPYDLPQGITQQTCVKLSLRFNMPTQTIPMLSKKPKAATADLPRPSLGTFEAVSVNRRIGFCNETSSQIVTQIVCQLLVVRYNVVLPSQVLIPVFEMLMLVFLNLKLRNLLQGKDDTIREFRTQYQHHENVELYDYLPQDSLDGLNGRNTREFYKDGTYHAESQVTGKTSRDLQHLKNPSIASNLQRSIKAAPYEALYRRKCRSPVCWSEGGDSQLTGLELIREMTEKIIQIKNRVLTARSRQKSYADRRTKPLEFEVGDMVLLRVSPWKGVVRFGKRVNVKVQLMAIQDCSNFGGGGSSEALLTLSYLKSSRDA